jgi:NAD(P)-dependent dehydrogenase (short-subunit alcohol dehydrogenase family)
VGRESFGYEGKRVLVVGGATGMGAAAARLVAAEGARVVVMDRAPVEFEVERAIAVDLRSVDDVDRALQEVDGSVDAVFSTAGVADGTPGLMAINFIAHRHVVESLAGDGRLGRGGAVCFVSSGAGIGWETQIPRLTEFVATEGFAAAQAWIEAHPKLDNYTFSKQAVSFYVAHEALRFLRSGIRINAVLPGPTDTPLARANADVWLGFAQGYRHAAGVGHLTAEQVASAMAFLNSDAASGINGVSLTIDSGHLASCISGSYDADRAIVDLMLGRS